MTPLSTAIADGCPPGASDKEYIRMLQGCILELSQERAMICAAHLQQVNALRQEIVDLDFRYSGELARARVVIWEIPTFTWPPSSSRS